MTKGKAALRHAGNEEIYMPAQTLFIGLKAPRWRSTPARETWFGNRP
jgi:hypothetical protein